MLLSKGIETVTVEQINEWDFVAKVREAKLAIPKEVATTWLEMNQKGALPSWAIGQVRIDMMEKAAL